MTAQRGKHKKYKNSTNELETTTRTIAYYFGTFCWTRFLSHP